MSVIASRRLGVGAALAGIGLLVALFSLLISPGADPASADGGGASPTPLPTHTITLLPSLTTTMDPYPYPASLQNSPAATPFDPQPPQAAGGFACWPLAILLIVIVIIFSSWRMGGGSRR